MPSNLYPGESSRNRSIQNNLDPPKKASATGDRTNEATTRAQLLYKKYKDAGLTVVNEPGGDGTKIKSADKPPNDGSDDYITIK